MKIYLLIFFAIGVLGVMGGEYIFAPLISKQVSKEEKIEILKKLIMFPIYGIGGMIISLLYLIPFLRDIKFLALLLLFGVLIGNMIELGSGMLLNKVLKLNIWDYSKERFNLFGQIDLLHTMVWAVLTPVIVNISEIIKLLAG